MEDIDLTPAGTLESLDQCWLCQNGGGIDSSKNGNVRVERYRNTGRHEETLANLVVTDTCANEIGELAGSLDGVHSAVTVEGSENPLFAANECGFCGDERQGDDQYRTSAGIIIHEGGPITLKKEVLLCDDCTDVFLDFLRDVGRAGR